jgi:sentrin-specific protease 8
MALLTVGDVTLYRHDLLTLNDGEWINDLIIEFWFQNLASSYPSLYFMSPSTAYLITQLNDARDLNIEIDADLVFIPVNNNIGTDAGGSHWSLLVHQRNIAFFYYDSMNNSNLRFAKIYQRAVECLLGIGECRFEIRDAPQQSNSYDCGAHVMGTTEYIARYYNSLQLMPESIPDNISTSVRKQARDLIAGYIFPDITRPSVTIIDEVE